MVKKLFLPVFFALLNLSVYAEVDLYSKVRYKEEMVAELKEEIAKIDSELARCNKSKNGWVAATVIGGAGVVATGTAAIVQSVKIKKKEAEEIKKQAEQK